MGYMHINNLYRDQTILLFRNCYALEKIHGTSAHIRWDGKRVWFSPGGESHERFVSLFSEGSLTQKFAAIGHESVTVFGEAYGGKQHKQAWRYGPELRFVAFEVRVGDSWLAVPQAHDFVGKLDLEFVYYVKIFTDLSVIDAERDAPSEQARRNGVDGDKPREGVVLRPLIEVRTNNGERIIAKHKRDEERETKTPRKVSLDKLEVLTQANAIAEEWVTPRRLEHVLDKLGPDIGIERTKDVISAMVEDVTREAGGEIVDSREARRAIGGKAAQLFKARLQKALRETVKA